MLSLSTAAFGDMCEMHCRDSPSRYSRLYVRVLRTEGRYVSVPDISPARCEGFPFNYTFLHDTATCVEHSAAR